MKRNNVVGSSTGYVERICESYSHVELLNVSIGKIDQNCKNSNIFETLVYLVNLFLTDKKIFPECA